MKKKRLRLVTTIAILAALFGSGGGTAWGQAYKKGYVTGKGKMELRRVNGAPHDTAYIGIVPTNGPLNVGGVQFGAGESVTIGGSGAVLLPTNPNSAFTPNGQTVNAVYIGSNVSENIVMNNYNADGRASGFLNFTATAPQNFNAGNFAVDQNGFNEYTPSYPAPPSPSYAHPYHGTQPSLFNPSPPTISPYNNNFSPWQRSLYQLAGALWSKVDMVNLSAPSYIDYIAHLYLSNHMPKVLCHWGVKASAKGGLPYTTTQGWWAASDTIDDGIDLVQSVGQPGIDVNANVGNANDPGSGKRYTRPTTVALESNTLDSIVFKELQWFLKAHNLETFPSNANKWYKETDYANTLQGTLVGGCSHVGILNVKLVEIGNWVITTLAGQNKLDAAVQILKGARVCVKDSVLDNTGNLGTTPERGGAKTDAAIVVPFYNRFTLRTKGNFKANMVHLDKDSIDTRNVIYPQAKFPIANHDNILLKSTTGDFQTLLAYQVWSSIRTIRFRSITTAPLRLLKSRITAPKAPYLVCMETICLPPLWQRSIRILYR